MPRGDYNGFTPEDQKRGGRIQQSAFKNGMLVRVWECEACLVEGKVPGDIIAHLEDYSDPIDGAIWLCYRCHTILHARFDHPRAWATYRQHISQGIRWPLTRSYGGVMENHCWYPTKHTGRNVNPFQENTILDYIEDGEFIPTEESFERMKKLHEHGIRYLKEQQDSLF